MLSLYLKKYIRLLRTYKEEVEQGVQGANS